MTTARSWLATAGTRLVPLAPHHMAALREVELSDYLIFRWRHHGAHPSPAEFEADIWSSGLCHFLVEDAQKRLCGFVSAYDADLAHGHCRMAAAQFDPRASGLSVLTGGFLLWDYLFRGWPIRKIYLESLDFNLAQFRGLLDDLAREEGVLRQHTYLEGAYHDLHILAIYREEWESGNSRAKRWLESRRARPGA